jgi:hypothetical protein
MDIPKAISIDDIPIADIDDFPGEYAGLYYEKKKSWWKKEYDKSKLHRIKITCDRLMELIKWFNNIKGEIAIRKYNDKEPDLFPYIIIFSDFNHPRGFAFTDKLTRDKVFDSLVESAWITLSH